MSISFFKLSLLTAFLKVALVTFSMDQPFDFLVLPTDMQLKIFSGIQPKTKNALRATCRVWAEQGAKKIPNVFNVVSDSPFCAAPADITFILFAAINQEREEVIKKLLANTSSQKHVYEFPISFDFYDGIACWSNFDCRQILLGKCLDEKKEHTSMRQVLNSHGCIYERDSPQGYFAGCVPYSVEMDSYCNDIDKIKKLVEKCKENPRVVLDNPYPIFIAMHKNQTEMVKLLLSVMKITAYYPLWYFLKLAIFLQKKDIFEVFLEGWKSERKTYETESIFRGVASPERQSRFPHLKLDEYSEILKKYLSLEFLEKYVKQQEKLKTETMG